jgi:hypothetical protein
MGLGSGQQMDGDGFRTDGFRTDRFRRDGFRIDGFKTDGFRTDGFRRDRFRTYGFRTDGLKTQTMSVTPYTRMIYNSYLSKNTMNEYNQHPRVPCVNILSLTLHEFNPKCNSTMATMP